ncbi:MAG: hypothetical protein Q8J92_02080 [Parvibaculum sp.]|nr:hypothetical protein [Parvibaculum sp.]
MSPHAAAQNKGRRVTGGLFVSAFGAAMPVDGGVSINRARGEGGGCDKKRAAFVSLPVPEFVSFRVAELVSAYVYAQVSGIVSEFGADAGISRLSLRDKYAARGFVTDL